jgi:hypothetical protein
MTDREALEERHKMRVAIANCLHAEIERNGPLLRPEGNQAILELADELLRAALAAREEPPDPDRFVRQREARIAALYERLHDHELLTPLDSKWADVGAGPKSAFRASVNAMLDTWLAAREEPATAPTHEYEMPESVIVARVAKAITDHRFSGGGTLGVGGPHALEIAKAAIAAFCAAREDTERPDGERIQELEEVVRACRSALICREALTPLFAEKIRAVLRDTEQEPRR